MSRRHLNRPGVSHLVDFMVVCHNWPMPPIALPYFSARPVGDGPWPGIVVIHEGGGISPQLLRLCQRLAAEGYATIAPDLFFRSGGSEAADYTTLIGGLVPEEVRADVQASAEVLRDLGAQRIGITGFCLGGRISWTTARRGDGFDAAVGFYGSGISDDLGEPQCPTLLFFGGQDPYIPPAEIERIVEHHPDTVVYPEAGHGFMRDRSESYHEKSANDAWVRTLAFFSAHLQ
jgi:carboxymethylenebutenolidase